MKALHVITGLGRGRRRAATAAAAAASARRLRRGDPDQPGHRRRRAGRRRGAGPAPRHGRATGTWARCPAWSGSIRRGGYDLVHTHLYRACVYGRLAARLAGVRAVVATEHSLGDSQMEGRPLTAGVRALYLAGERLGRATVAVSPTVAERLQALGRARAPGSRSCPTASTWPASASSRRAAATPAVGSACRTTAYVIGGVGRLAPGKRFDVLIRALAQLPDDHWLLLVGGGPEEERAAPAPPTRRASPTGCCSPANAPTSPTARPAPICRRSPAAMDVLASPSPRRPSASRSWRRWHPVCPCSTPPARRSRTCRRPRRPAARRVTGGPEAFARAVAGRARARARARAPRPTPPATTASPAAPPSSWTCTPPRSPLSPVPVTSRESVPHDRAPPPGSTARSPCPRQGPAPLVPARGRGPRRRSARAARTACSRHPRTRPRAMSSPCRPRSPTRRPRSASPRRTAGSPPSSRCSATPRCGRACPCRRCGTTCGRRPRRTRRWSSVTATSARPDQAADMANAVARALTRHANDTQASHPRRTPAVRPRGAGPPSRPRRRRR